MKTFTLLTIGFLCGALAVAACSKSEKTAPVAAAPSVQAASVAPTTYPGAVDAQTATVAAKASAAAAAQHKAAKALTDSVAAVTVVSHRARVSVPRAGAGKKAPCLSEAEKWAYIKAWENAITANVLLGRHAFQEVFEVPKRFCHQ